MQQSWKDRVQSCVVVQQWWYRLLSVLYDKIRCWRSPQIKGIFITLCKIPAASTELLKSAPVNHWHNFKQLHVRLSTLGGGWVMVESSSTISILILGLICPSPCSPPSLSTPPPQSVPPFPCPPAIQWSAYLLQWVLVSNWWQDVSTDLFIWQDSPLHQYNIPSTIFVMVQVLVPPAKTI